MINDAVVDLRSVEDRSDLNSHHVDSIFDRIINSLELSLTIPVHGMTSHLNADYVLTVYAQTWLRYAGFYLSSWITTVISMERCLCVVAPFKVKRWLTRRRCCLIIVFICAAYMALITPIFVFEKITWAEQGTYIARGNNATAMVILEPSVERSHLTIELEETIDTIGAICLSLLSHAILIVCTLWMVYSLKASSVVRQPLNDPPVHFSTKPTSRSSEVTLSPRERKLVKVVLYLTVVLTACNIPRYTVLAAHHLVPGMIVGAYANLSLFMWDVSDFLGTQNCSSSFLVYWMLNSKFRIAFYQLFSPKCVKN
ncbi:hypothetical protein Btru_073271 [Bulinus truncatus]|nr:hypothetical protein Btru_073271 [Bulinus truncatus]